MLAYYEASILRKQSGDKKVLNSVKKFIEELIVVRYELGFDVLGLLH